MIEGYKVWGVLKSVLGKRSLVGSISEEVSVQGSNCTT